jgi:hypothetical protein
VIPAFGLFSYSAIYCQDDKRIPEIATASVEVTGIDFAVYTDAADVVVESARGRARIEYDAAVDSYRYVTVKGDPLQLGSYSNGFATDAEWFERTAGHRYPNAVANLYKSLFTPRVKHTADILLSLQDGYYYGWSPFGRFVRLAATHGNALQSSSNAFLMSTHQQLPAYIRADNARVYLRH